MRRTRFKDWRVTRLILNLFQQGMSAEKIALCLTLGVMLGVFPVLGSTTLLCGFAVFIFKLNLPLIQLVNYFVYPLQLILILPFWRMGQWLFGDKPISMSMTELIQMIHQDVWGSILRLWVVTLEGTAAWVMAAVPLGLLFYFSLVFLLRGFLKGKQHG